MREDAAKELSELAGEWAEFLHKAGGQRGWANPKVQAAAQAGRRKGQIGKPPGEMRLSEFLARESEKNKKWADAMRRTGESEGYIKDWLRQKERDAIARHRWYVKRAAEGRRG